MSAYRETGREQLLVEELRKAQGEVARLKAKPARAPLSIRRATVTVMGFTSVVFLVMASIALVAETVGKASVVSATGAIAGLCMIWCAAAAVLFGIDSVRRSA